MSRLVLLTPADADPGFALAGVSQETAVPGEVEAVLRRILGTPGVGAVAIDERLLTEVAEDRLRALERGARALLLVLPAPAGGEAEEDYVRRLLRRVLGYQVRIRT